MKKQNTELPRIDLVPLLDALFCTLFFYMAFSFFSSPAPAKHVPVKKAIHSKQPAQKAAHVWVKEDGSILVNGSMMQKAQLISFFKENKSSFKLTSVGGDDNVRVEDIQTVIHWLKSSGVTSISFRVK